VDKMQKIYPSIPVLKEDEGKIVEISYKPEAKYLISSGQAISRFLNELKNGKIIGRKCFKCNRILVPPRMYCEICFKSTDEWVYVRDIGKVVTAVVSYITVDARKAEKPEVVGIIEFIDAPTQGIFHRINVNPEYVVNRKIFGVTVKAVWKKENERKGDINDILYFEPIEEIK
jgi:uncharacterized OB-fold protein